MNTEQYKVQRIASHGQITSLESAFYLRGAKPFSIFVIPKDEAETAPVLVNCKCILDDTNSPLPVPLNSWTEAAILSIAAEAVDLEDYDVYWGAGENAEES